MHWLSFSKILKDCLGVYCMSVHSIAYTYRLSLGYWNSVSAPKSQPVVYRLGIQWFMMQVFNWNTTHWLTNPSMGSIRCYDYLKHYCLNNCSTCLWEKLWLVLPCSKLSFHELWVDNFSAYLFHNYFILLLSWFICTEKL